jgi:hypothetical protein
MIPPSPYHHRHLPVTESWALPPDQKGKHHGLHFNERADYKILYNLAELVELRRTMLRFARSLPLRSSERNQRRQIAASLRTLFNDKKWLDANTVEGSRLNSPQRRGGTHPTHLLIFQRTIEIHCNAAGTGLPFRSAKSSVRADRPCQ